MLDWCELCNGAHDSFRNKIAAAAGTDPTHVAVQCVHQHTAPLVDMDAQKLLAEVGALGLQLAPKSFKAIEERLATAVKQSLARLEPFDQIGTGQAKVDRVASNRRPVDATGKIVFRGSFCKSPAIRALPEGAIDPYLKTITLAQGRKPLVRLHYYATHPQSFYGDNRASSDVPGDAREELERKERVFQIYFNGCGGDVAMGKYNDGSRKDHGELAERLLAGMEASIAVTKLAPAGPIRWRTHPLLLPPRTDKGFTLSESLARMKCRHLCGRAGVLRVPERSLHPAKPTADRAELAGNRQRAHRASAGRADGLLPAVRARPQAGSICGRGRIWRWVPGYLCTEKAYREGSYEPSASRVKPESEALVKKAIAALLGAD